MRIGFDAKRLYHNQTGLGVYSRLLVQTLRSLDAEFDPVLFSKAIGKSPHASTFSEVSSIEGSGLLWRRRGIVRDIVASGCQVYHGLSHELPWGIERVGVPTVVTIHDLVFERDPKLYPWIDRKIYREKWKHSTRVADLVVCVSDHTRQDLIELYHTSAEKIRVVAPMHDPHFELAADPGMQDQIRKKYSLPENYFLYVGSVTRRKNLLSILRAMHSLAPSDRIPLVVIGSGGKYLHECRAAMQSFRLEQEVTFCQEVPNVELPPFYQMATALIYPSFYEGFGIPVIESLFCHTPVITSRSSSLPEAAGPGAILVDPADAHELADAMRRLASDEELQKSLAVLGHDYVKRYSNTELGQQILKIYRDLLAF